MQMIKSHITGYAEKAANDPEWMEKEREYFLDKDCWLFAASLHHFIELKVEVIHQNLNFSPVFFTTDMTDVKNFIYQLFDINTMKQWVFIWQFT